MKLDDVIEFAKRYESVYIYGAGELGKSLLDVLIDENIMVSGFIISDNQSIISPTVSGIPVSTLSNWCQSAKNLKSVIFVVVSRYYQADIVNSLKQKGVSDYLLVERDVLHNGMRKLYPVNSAKFLTTINPVSRSFGADRGKPIDRVYIEKFLQDNAKNLQNATDILEVGSDDYSRKYFSYSDKPVRYHILCYENGMDLTDVKTLQKELCDVFICTQVFNFIYDVKAAIYGAHYLLKRGGGYY